MRLIDADWMLEHKYKELVSYDTYDLEEILKCVPTVEQKHGHWELSAYCNHKPYRLRHADKWTIWKCSVCGKNNGRCHSDAYCRHCGAKMDEEVTE